MGSCPSCFPRRRKKSSEREPLLPSYRDDATGREPPEPLFYKLAEFLDALQKGKLPSQDQLNIILQAILKSSLLRDDSHVVPRYGSLSQSGERFLEDVREMVEALLQIGMEKNGDNKLQDLIYQCSKVNGPPVYIKADAAIDAADGLTHLHAEAPSPSELSSDTSVFLRSLPSLLRLILTSAFFRLLLSDIRKLLAGLASNVASVASEAHVAAERVERAIDIDDEWFSVLQDEVEETAQAVENMNPTAKAKATAKDVFVSRVQELIVRAHEDPQSLSALQTIRSITSKYAQKLSRSAKIMANVNASSSAAESRPGTYRGPDIVITPTAETSQALGDLKLLLERLASGHSIDPLLCSISDTIQGLLESSSCPSNNDLRNFVGDVDTFLQRALAPSLPSSSHEPPHRRGNLYITSRSARHALEALYERGSDIFPTDDDQYLKQKWRASFQTLLDEYDAYISALQSDYSTSKFMRIVDKISASGSNLLELGLGVGVAGAKRRKEQIVRDLVGWVVPRMGKLLLRLLPIPRLEFRSGRVMGALEFGFLEAGVVKVESELVPDSVVLKSWNETKVDVVPASEELDNGGRSIRTSSSSRIHIHVEGLRFSAHNVGYFVRYNTQWPWVGYVDQGLVSVDVGRCSTGGLSADIELEIDFPVKPIAEDDRGDQDLSPFRVVAVKLSLSDLTFTLSKSKHYVLNKLFVQPLAGPLVSKIVTGVLEEQMDKALVGLADAWGEVKAEVERKRQRRGPGSEEGLMSDCVETVTEVVTRLLREEDGKSETYTDVTMNGLVHTRVNVGDDHDTSTRHDHVQEETVIAVGAGAQLFPDKAGPYGEDGATPVLEDAVGEVVNGVQVMFDNETREGGGEAREEIEHAERRRKKRVRFEEIHREDGMWRSAAFNI